MDIFLTLDIEQWIIMIQNLKNFIKEWTRSLVSTKPIRILFIPEMSLISSSFKIDVHLRAAFINFFYSENEIITVCGRPAICTLIGWVKSSCLFSSLSGLCAEQKRRNIKVQIESLPTYFIEA